MKHTYYYIIVFILSIFRLEAQDKETRITLPQAVKMAQENSPDAIAARHSFRASYWNYKFYQANYLPSVTLSSTPTLNREINKITQPDGTEAFLRQNQLNTDINLKINQNIWFTGGSLFIGSSIQRIDIFNENTTAYRTSPAVIGYEQELLGYNSLKWSRRIEPIRYSESRKKYIETLELVATETSRKFFELATAQTNYEIAAFNYANADTLYQYAQGRYAIGTITENEILQLELNKLTEEANMMNARIEMDNQTQILRSYLGITDGRNVTAVIDEHIPRFTISLTKAIEEAFSNNPDIESMRRRKLESENNIAKVKGTTGLKADLYIQFGLSQTGDNIPASYRNPMNQQYASLGISIPVLDWGKTKGQIKVARSNRDMVYTQIEQEKINFAMNIRKMVNQFNLQAYRVNIAQKTDITAQRRNNVAQRLYLLGKSTVLDLNASISEKDKARRNYIGALADYWNLYYGLRSLTLFDFQENKPLTENFKVLLK